MGLDAGPLRPARAPASAAAPGAADPLGRAVLSGAGEGGISGPAGGATGLPSGVPSALSTRGARVRAHAGQLLLGGVRRFEPVRAARCLAHAEARRMEGVVALPRLSRRAFSRLSLLGGEEEQR